MRSFVTLCAFMFALTGCITTSVDGVSAGPGLRILLTNDDGYRSPGLLAVRAALESAGHDVTVVAPLENRSGAGASMTTTGTLALREQGPNLWSVGGTPADAVRVGLKLVLADTPPDLVVSGANFGQNIGPSTLHSGTVGAALTAMQLGVPAIAISVGIDLKEARSEPRFASTIAAFDDASDFVVSVIASLRASSTRSQGLLPEYTVLNINYPARESEEVEGVEWANIGRAGQFAVAFERNGTEPVRILLAASEDVETVAYADTELFAAGNVTLTLLDGDLAVPEEARKSFDQRLGTIAP